MQKFEVECAVVQKPSLAPRETHTGRALAEPGSGGRRPARVPQVARLCCVP